MRNKTTYLFRTLHGRTATASVSSLATYEAFIQSLFLASAARDRGGNCYSTRAVSSSSRPFCSDTFGAGRAYVVGGDGRILDRDGYRSLVLSRQSPPSSRLCPANRDDEEEVHLGSLRLRILGGMADRQNRVGSKFGGGGVSSDQRSERERKERLRQLALESVDLARDPYLMRNHLGTYECKLCLTLHTNEGNYLAHTQGKKHKAGLARRAAMEKRARDAQPAPLTTAGAGASAATRRIPRVRIGRPGYQITKSRDPDTNQRCLSFELHYPELDDPESVQPRHRFMSAYEQRVESPPDRRFQYLLVACDPYETVAFKVPNEPVDRGEGRFVSNWDREGKSFTVTFFFMEPQDGTTD